MTGKPWRIVDNRLLLRVRLTPKSSRDAVEGIGETAFGPALEARVQAVADKGRANAALVELIARSLKLRKAAVVMTGGFKSRIKTLVIAGEPQPLAALLDEKFDKPV